LSDKAGPCRFRRTSYIPPMDIEYTEKQPPKGGRIAVAMSGGVDSSVAAALMVERGYDVVGITLQLYDHGQAIQKKGACCAGVDIHDARRVADSIGIPHYVLDYETRFREQVMEDFADSYLKGETPIPCVRCNQTVKFHDLLQTARDLGAEGLVTGHYVRHMEGVEGSQLFKGLDADKDQSYFLFTTTQEQLDYLYFPLGGMDKKTTRSHAARLGLKVAEKPESQDICFVPAGKYADVVEKLRPGAAEPGDIVDRDGNVVGQHQGIIHYTVGQRRGLGISAADPLYVTALDAINKRVIVGPKNALLCDGLTARELNWLIARPGIGQRLHCQIKVRSAASPINATVSANADETVDVSFDEPQAGIAPGQAAVFYDGDRVLGGGWISGQYKSQIM